MALCGHALQAADADALILEVIRERQQSLPCMDHSMAMPNYIPSPFVLPHSQLPLWPSSLSSSFSSPFCSAPLVVGWTVGSQLPRFHSPSLAFSVGEYIVRQQYQQSSGEGKTDCLIQYNSI